MAWPYSGLNICLCKVQHANGFNLTAGFFCNQFNTVDDRHRMERLHVFKLGDVALAKFHYLQSFKLHNLAYLRPEPNVLLTLLVFVTGEC
jgi:hypothetical protein